MDQFGLKINRIIETFEKKRKLRILIQITFFILNCILTSRFNSIDDN